MAHTQGRIQKGKESTRDGVLGCIGNTPLVKLQSLSDATGCQIFAKVEMMNPGGSIKDRVALRIVEDALEAGLLAPGGLVTEGTAGSTGVALAMVCAAKGLKCDPALTLFQSRTRPRLRCGTYLAVQLITASHVSVHIQHSCWP